VMFQAEYSSGQPLCMVVDLRTAVEAALALTAKEPKAMAAAASGTAMEFEVAAGSREQESEQS